MPECGSVNGTLSEFGFNRAYVVDTQRSRSGGERWFALV
jgi:hypothetical protein